MRLPLRLLCAVAGSLAFAAPAGAADNGAALLKQAGVRQGLCLHLGCGGSSSASLTADLAGAGGLLVHGLALDAAAAERARTAIRKRGLQGQAQVETLAAPPLPYVPDLADLVVVEDAAALKKAGIGPDEVDRVLAPGGVRLEKKGGRWEKAVKPRREKRPWSHPLGGPDGNRVADDPVVFPVGLRWQDGLPLNIVHWASVRSYVAADGRVFSIGMTEEENLLTGAGARAAKQQWLVGRSAASGLPLWKLALGTEDPKSDLNTLNALPLATDGTLVLAPKGKGLVAVSAADGSVARELPVAFPTARLVFADGVAVAAGWADMGRKEMWDPGTKPGSSLWDVRFSAADQGAVEAFDPATGKRLWQDPAVAQQILASDGKAVYLVQGAYPVQAQAVVARALKTGKELWRTPHAELGGAADLFLVCVGRETVVLGRHKAGSKGAGVGCRQIVVLSLGDGKKRWEADGDGHPMALFAGDALWYGSKRYEPATGKILGDNPMGIRPGMCVPPMLLGDVGGTPRGGDWVDVKTRARYRSGGVRGSCVQGGAAADGRLFVAQNWCRCAPAQVPGFVALGAATPPSDGAFAATRPVEAAGKPAAAPSTADTAADWPTFRHDPDRSGSCAVDAPAGLGVIWKASPLPAKPHPLVEVWADALQPRLSAPVAAGTLACVAACGEGEVVAMDLASGRERWRASTGARLDSPPTVHGGLCLAPSHDGWLYAFAAADGRLVWRTRVAPEERRLVAFGQVESAWPVVGSPLVVDGTGYAVAGRSTEMDGGCALVAFDPATGATRWGAKVAAAPGRRCDVLAWVEGALDMQCWTFDPADGKAKPGGRSGENLDGLLDGSWARLGNRRSGNLPAGKLSADVVVWDTARYYGFGGKAGHRVIAVDRDAADAADPKKPQATGLAWTWACPRERQVEALAVAKNALVAAGRVWDDDPKKMRGFALLLSRDDGKVIAEAELPAAPVPHGLCVVPGRVVACLEDGTVVCLGGR